jgi:hypothetical protein
VGVRGRGVGEGLGQICCRYPVVSRRRRTSKDSVFEIEDGVSICPVMHNSPFVKPVAIAGRRVHVHSAVVLLFHNRLRPEP